MEERTAVFFTCLVLRSADVSLWVIVCGPKCSHVPTLTHGAVVLHVTTPLQ